MYSILISLALLIIATPFVRGYTVQELRCEVCKAVVAEVESIIEKVSLTKKSVLTNVGSFRLDEKGNIKSKTVPLIQSEAFLLDAFESACNLMEEYARGYDKTTGKLRVVRMKSGETLNPEMTEINAISDADLNESLKYNCEDITDAHEREFLRVFKMQGSDNKGRLCVEATGLCKGKEDKAEL